MASKQMGEATSLMQQILELVIMVLLVIGCYFGLREFVVGTYEIPSGSMLDTIQIGDRVFSEKISYYSRGPIPGEVITFADPLDEQTTLIKRVIAVGGDEVDLIDGAVYVNGQKLDEPSVSGHANIIYWPLNHIGALE